MDLPVSPVQPLPPSFTCLGLAIASGVATLTLRRPDVMNALSMAMLVELADALKWVIATRDVRCLVITGDGKGFCTGSDQKAPRPGLNPDDPDAFLRDYFVPPFRLLSALDIPCIAAVNGPAVGAGMSLALACDIVVAAESAYFMQPFVHIGLVPDLGSSWYLPHQVGLARAAGLMLLGERLPARDAAGWGLIWRSAPDDVLQQETQALAMRLAAGSAAAMARTKELLRQSHRNGLEVQMQRELEFQRACMGGPDAREARLAFAEKRKPVFASTARPA